LRVAPGGSAPPIPCVARRGRGGVRSGQESRLADQTEKLIRRYRGAEASGIPLRPDDDRNLRLSSTNYRHPQLRIHTERRLTKHRRAGSILMRQCPARSGAFLDEATRPAITRVALQHALIPVPNAILRRGPDDPQALPWLWTHWGTTEMLRHVAGKKPMPQSDGDERHLKRQFGSSPSGRRALAQIAAGWPALRFDLRPTYDPL
jgi:hypothetical protein